MIKPTILLAAECNKISNKELGNRLSQLLIEAAESLRSFEEFESPICAENLCRQRRGVFWPEASLMEYAALKPFLDSGKKYPVTLPSRVRCKIKNETDSTNLELSNDSGLMTPHEGSFESKYLNSLIISRAVLFENSVEVTLEHNSLTHLIAGDGFASRSHFQIDGLLQLGSLKKISARFSIMSPEVPINQFGGNKGGYNMFDPFFASIEAAPKILKEYSLTCQID